MQIYAKIFVYIKLKQYLCTMEHISKAQIKIVRSLQQKKYRDELGLFVAEGAKCIEELCKGFESVWVIKTADTDRAQTASLIEYRPAKGEVFWASESEIAQMSGMKTPQGVIGVFRKRGDGLQVTGYDNLTLVLDGVQDPGNLGTIIRTCDWFGVKQIVCSTDTADCYNPKVVQATMGALTRVGLTYTNLPEWLEGLRVTDDGLRIYGTVLDGENMYARLTSNEYQLTSNDARGAISSVIIMGNEGNGISQAVRKYITHPIRIPSYPPEAETSESLNVAIATAIVLAEFRRPR